MKNLFSGTAILAAAFVAMPASAQLLGGGGGLVGGELSLFEQLGDASEIVGGASAGPRA